MFKNTMFKRSEKPPANLRAGGFFNFRPANYMGKLL